MTCITTKRRIPQTEGSDAVHFLLEEHPHHVAVALDVENACNRAIRSVFISEAGKCQPGLLSFTLLMYGPDSA